MACALMNNCIIVARQINACVVQATTYNTNENITNNNDINSVLTPNSVLTTDSISTDTSNITSLLDISNRWISEYPVSLNTTDGITTIRGRIDMMFYDKSNLCVTLIEIKLSIQPWKTEIIDRYMLQLFLYAAALDVIPKGTQVVLVLLNLATLDCYTRTVHDIETIRYWCSTVLLPQTAILLDFLRVVNINHI